MTEQLISYGGLGLLTLGAATAAIRIYRDKLKQDDRHRAELKVMIDRYVEGMRTYQDQYHAFAEKVHSLTVRLEAKIDRR